MGDGIGKFIFHSKLDYCNSLYFNLPNSEINRLQQIQNSLARTVVKSSRFSHITPVLKSLHWLKVKEYIEYKLLSLTNKVLTKSQRTHLFKLVSVQSPCCTRSTSVVTISRPTTSSSLKITNRSFQHAAPHLWNKLPHSFREPQCLIHILVFHPLTTLHMSDPHCHHHHFHYQSLLLFLL